MRMIDERSHKDVSHECFIWIAPNSIDKRFKWNWFDWFPFELNGAPKCQGRLFSGWERFNEMLKQCTSGSIEIETIVEYCVMRWSTIPHVKSFNKDTQYPVPTTGIRPWQNLFHFSSWLFLWLHLANFANEIQRATPSKSIPAAMNASIQCVAHRSKASSQFVLQLKRRSRCKRQHIVQPCDRVKKEMKKQNRNSQKKRDNDWNELNTYILKGNDNGWIAWASGYTIYGNDHGCCYVLRDSCLRCSAGRILPQYTFDGRNQQSCHNCHMQIAQMVRTALARRRENGSS